MATRKPKANRVPAAKARARTAARGRAAGGSAAPRADFGAPVEVFLARQPPELRALVDALRALVAEAAPDATGSLKWGMPWYAVEGEGFCAIAGFRAHVNLILPGAAGTFADPGGLLEGESRLGSHLKLRPGAEIPRAVIRGWLRTAVRAARSRARK